MADSTKAIVRLTRVSIVLGVVGGIAILWNLYETRRTAEAAMGANRIAREVGQKQLRAYIGVTSGGITVASDGKKASGIIILQNFGQTPAKDVNFWVEIDLLAFDDVMDIPSPTKGVELSKSPINPSQSGTVNFGLDMTEDKLNMVREKRFAFFVRGWVRYTDVFDQPRETPLSYRMAGREYSYVAGKPDVLGWALKPTDYGNEAT